MGALADFFGRLNPFRARPSSSVQRVDLGPGWMKRRYGAAMMDRLTADWIASPYSANAEIRQDLRSLRMRQRQLFRDNPWVRRWNKSLVRNVVGPMGIRVRPMAVNGRGDKDQRARDLLAESFAEWSKCGICTVDGQMSFVDAQGIIVKAISNDGDVLIRHIRGPEAGNRWNYAIQILESDHLVEDDTFRSMPGGQSVFMGVQTNRFRRPIAFHLHEMHPGDDVVALGSGLNRQVVISAGDMMLPFILERPGQTRGVPWPHAAMRRLNDVGRYEEAEIVAARVGSSKMGFYKSVTGEEFAADAREGDEEDPQLLEEVSPGTLRELPNGIDFVPFDPQHPTSAFEPFMSAMLHGVAAGLDTSYAELSGDLSQVNFSSIRHGAESDRDAWRSLQIWMAGRILEPIWREWLTMGLTSQAVAMPLARFDELVRVQWRPRGWSYVDPAKEISARKDEVALKVNTRTNIAAQAGRDFGEILDELVDEEALAAEKGIDLTPPAPAAPTPAPPAADADEADEADEADDDEDDEEGDDDAG